eukprot:TRINITY_DN2061_c0_g4_i1.p2 TRINITY_DN2061_c0_g4~~TRINITY_DN2061_c0_g4_i1.p2  ORF type:complete len:200 (-),score=19.19 TRINITY_DN2061_c0_g4_i1:3326-3925(-)
MTHFIAHRVNTVRELRTLPKEFGVEIDLRDRGDRLILQHDPFSDGEDFEAYASEYQHGTMILNIKSERIEHRVLNILKKYGIADYFFLDSTVPMIYLLSNNGEKNSAVRFSEIEPIENVLAMKDRCKWVWVDCFSMLPITKKIENQLRDAGFKLCLVSPELQGRTADIEAYKKQLGEEDICFDAICSKQYNEERWRAYL